MTAPHVDVVVAVHTAQRPVERAVGSVLRNTAAPVRVTVVCHNIDQTVVAARLGEWASDSRLRMLSLNDSIPSPAGPFNLGLHHATAPFTAVLGSDDELEPGAVDSWLSLQRKHSADVVIPHLKLSNGTSLRSSATRPFRTKQLDGVRDRLAYRTAQLGIVSRTRFPELRFTTGLRTGEDINYGLRLWFSDARISFDRRGPAYAIHADDKDRTTTSAKSVAEDFAFLDTVLDPQWTTSLTKFQRESIAVKLLRTHVMDAIKSRFLKDSATSAEERALAAVITQITHFSPTAADLVSRRDRRILDLLLSGAPDVAVLQAELAVRSDFRRPDNLLSSSSAKLFHREAPLRFLTALALNP